MAKKTPADFEQQMQRLQTIVQELERADLPLEQNVALYKEGRRLADACAQLLEKARNEIMLCTDGKETPFAIGEDETEDT